VTGKKKMIKLIISRHKNRSFSGFPGRNSPMAKKKHQFTQIQLISIKKLSYNDFIIFYLRAIQ